ncbi:MAG: ATP-binding cassette domain-containing protein [Gammaproteobacteria bacterium]|nr:ATP-binding cassette domain-containing protein [Gammaproteobacteria bacterium]
MDFQLEAGQIVGLSGASGSGKTLILKALADLLPHAGRVALGGVNAAAMNPSQWRKQVGYLSAESQWWLDSVGAHFQQRDDLRLGCLGLPVLAWDWPVARLSSGEKQRLGLLRLLQNSPRCLLLDEPTASLDQAMTAQVENLLQEYVVQQHACGLWVSHSHEQISRVATRHWRLDAGALQIHE